MKFGGVREANNGVAVAPQRLGHALKAMFDSVALAPLPEGLLQLVDDLEDARPAVRRAPELRTLA